MKLLLPVILFQLFMNTGMSQQNYDTLYIANHKVNCTGVAPQECFLIKNSVNEEWKFHYSEISGFEYTAGNEYVIIAEKLYVATQVADAPSFYYNLNEIISKEPTMVITDSDREKLGGRTFVMTGMIMDEKFNSEADLSNVNLVFDLVNNKVSGKDGCNRISGKIKVNSEKIEFLPMATTKMMCENTVVFTSFHKNINITNNFKITYDGLKFFNDDVLQMEFKIQK